MLAGRARRSDRLSSIGLTRLPWFCRKMYGGPSGVLGRTIRFTRIQLTRPSAELLRTVRFTKCQPNSVSEGSVKFSLVAGDSTVTLHGNLMKSYDPNFCLQRSLGLNSLPHRLLWDKAQNTTKNMMHARPTLKFIFIFLEKLEISHACTTLGAFRL